MSNEIGSIGRLVLEVGLNESALERGLLFFVLIREGYRVLQIPELRQHFSLHYSKTLSTGPAGNRIPAYRSTVENLSYRANQVAIYPSLKSCQETELVLSGPCSMQSLELYHLKDIVLCTA